MRKRAASLGAALATSLCCATAFFLQDATADEKAYPQVAPPAQPFQRLDGCVYKLQRWNDGDSFHVVLPDQKEVIFRLYFVDTPEEERAYADRIAEQTAYFGISLEAAVEIGREASEFTKQALAKPFTIYTRWRRALGRSANWRYYAIVITADGRDLNELLVSNGLTRVYGNTNATAGRARFTRILGAPARAREQSKRGKAGRLEQNGVKLLYAVATLSVRETEVLRLLGDGKTTNEIGAELKITVKTVQDFYQKLKRKLRAENIHQLIRIALLSREGLRRLL